jgi:hypothetical protein
LLARERKAADAIVFFAHLRDNASAASASSPAVIKQQIVQQGLVAVTDAEWRRHLLNTRRAQAGTTFTDTVRAVAFTAAELYTPEEQEAFAKLLDSRRVDRPLDEVVSVWIPAATAAILKDREAEWRRDVLLHGGALAFAQLESYAWFQRARMDFTPLAETLDSYAALLPGAQPVTWRAKLQIFARLSFAIGTRTPSNASLISISDAIPRRFSRSQRIPMKALRRCNELRFRKGGRASRPPGDRSRSASARSLA